MVRKCLFLLTLTLVFARLAAQTTATVTLDSNFAETGVPFIIHFSVPKLAGSEPEAVDFSTWDPVVPKENRLEQSQWRDEGSQYVADLTLIAFDADTLRLPTLGIQLQGGGKALSNPLEVIVLPTPAPDDLNDMAEIKDIRRESKWWTDYWPWAAGALGVLLLLGALFWLAARADKRKRAAVSRSIEAPPHERALRRLEVLTTKRLWQQGQIKEYYAELTHILREYLEKRYQVPALESTSEQLTIQLAQTDFPDGQLATLRELLIQADLAKFAKAEPPMDFHHQAWQEVRQVVAQTGVMEPPLAAAD